MAISSIVRPACIVLGTLGLIQGLIVFALAAFGILVHLCVIVVSPDGSVSYSDFFPLMVGLYFQGDDCQVYNSTQLHDDSLPNLVQPEWLFIWTAVYAGVSMLWVSSSICIMNKYLYEEKMLHYFLFFWALLTLGNCGMDLTLAVYFGSDFVDLTSPSSETTIPELLPAVAIMMVIISLKGVVLWFVNLVCGVYAVVVLWKYAKHKDDDKPLFLEQAGYINRSPISAFSPVSRPTSLTLASDLNDLTSASALQLRSRLAQEQSRSDLQSPIADLKPWELWGKQAPLNIPDPDYSPPSTVALRDHGESEIPRIPRVFSITSMPLKPALKKTQKNYDKKEDISI